MDYIVITTKGKYNLIKGADKLHSFWRRVTQVFSARVTTHIKEVNMLKLTHLRCLSMDCPIGIEERPYFSWILTSDEQDTVQTAYCVTVKNEQGETVWKKEENSDTV